MNDTQIKGLFRSHKTEVADNGFTGRVMTRLSRRSSILPQIIVAAFSLAGMAAVVAITGIKPFEELWRGVSSLSGVSISGNMINTYFFIVAAITVIGLSIKKAAA